MPVVNYIGWISYPLSLCTSKLKCDCCNTKFIDDYNCEILSFNLFNNTMSESEANKITFSKKVKINKNKKLTMRIKICKDVVRECVCGGNRIYDLCDFVDNLSTLNFSITLNELNKTFQYDKNEIKVVKCNKWITFEVEYISHIEHNLEELYYNLNFDDVELQNCCCKKKSNNPINYAHIKLQLEELKDSDCDGIPDEFDSAPCDSNNTELKDTDGDNVPDLFDKHLYDSNCTNLVDPEDPNNENEGDYDQDEDNIPSNYDKDDCDSNNTELKDMDEDNIPDVFDKDKDGDNIPGNLEVYDCDSNNTELKDTDGDNVPDLFDKDPCDSNVDDLVDPNVPCDNNVEDTDEDKIPDKYDEDENDSTNMELKDSDSNDIPDVLEEC